MTDALNRDPRTGRFAVSTANAPESSAGKFPTRTEIPFDNVSAEDVLPGMEISRYAPAEHDPARGGLQRMIEHRSAVLTPDDERAETIYADHRQSAFTRESARRQGGDTDPARWLTGADDGLPPDVRALITGFSPRAASVAPEAQKEAE